MREHLRGISTTGHIAGTLGAHSGSVYESVTTDCEKKLAILGLEVDPLMGGNNRTYSIGCCTLRPQLKSLEMSKRQYSSPQSAYRCPEAPFGRCVRKHCPYIFPDFFS